jgi:glutamate racemase
VAQPLSAYIEAGRAGSPQFLADLTRIVAPLKKVEALVLACTHYPAAGRWFAAALPDALLIDPAERLAAAVAERHPQARHAQSPAARIFLTTGDPDAMRHGATRAWGTPLTATAIPC